MLILMIVIVKFQWKDYNSIQFFFLFYSSSILYLCNDDIVGLVLTFSYSFASSQLHIRSNCTRECYESSV